MIYTASSECEIFRNLHATKMARVGKIWDLGLDLMPISYWKLLILFFVMKLCPKFEISEKTVSKDYSLERPRRTRNIKTRLST